MSSSSAIPINVNLGDPSMVNILSNLVKDIAKSKKRPLSVHIFNHPSNEYERGTRRITEGVAVRSVLSLLSLHFDRIRTFVVHTELRSSLGGVVERVRGHAVAERISMYDDIDDTARTPA
ncbi:hypothetical protein FA13DRAFT_483161 [Coprinellus micaceus]|uniref:Uncharacterized protein n=1 Tax=Coprinellus micaceus TaxID=71717 RepID=A0A4Y7TAJ6_COPMI|nr:hypothetical protein FA13DRAFT_483161 [Coprinellus micaceus]